MNGPLMPLAGSTPPSALGPTALATPAPTPPDARTVSPRSFTDPELYARELERVFGRAWLCVGHTSQLGHHGDFVTARMGQDPIIVCRGRDDALHVFLNSCPHKGALVCREDRGHTKSFICPYHARTFDTSGKLLGIAGAKLTDLADPEADLLAVPRVDVLAGLVFACFDPHAAPLVEALGPMATLLPALLAQAGAAPVVLDGAHRARVAANWKFAMAEPIGDGAHLAAWAHAPEALDHGFVAALAGGHGLVARPERLGPPAEGPAPALAPGVYVATVFPNLIVVASPGAVSLRVVQPLGPATTELYSLGLVSSSLPPEALGAARARVARQTSPSGPHEQRTLAAWESSHAGLAGAQRGLRPLHFRAPPLEPSAAALPVPAQLGPPGAEHASWAFFERWAREVDDR